MRTVLAWPASPGLRIRQLFEGFDMQAVNFVFVPYPVPVGNGVGWEKRAKPPPYPRHSPVNWSPREAIPVRDLRQVRDLLNDAKRLIADQRAAKLLRELGG